MNALHLCWVKFWELNMFFGSLVELLACCIYLLVFFPPWKTPFLQARQLLDRSSIDSFLSSLSFSFLNRSSKDSRSIMEFSCALCLLNTISTASQSIEISGFLLDNFFDPLSQISMLTVCSIDSQQILDPPRHSFCCQQILNSTSTNSFLSRFKARQIPDKSLIHQDVVFYI